MEGEVAFELGMCDWEVSVAVCIGWMYCFHASIKAQDEEAQVEPQAKAIRDCYLAPELIKLELSSWRLSIVTYCPNVSCINEGCSVYLPEEVSAVFCIKVKLDVTCLIDEVYASVCALETAWSKLTNAPASHTVCTSAEVSFFIGKDA